MSLLVFRRRTHQSVRAGAGQRGDGALEAELCQRLSLALARAKAGAPEQALSLLTGKRSAVCRQPTHTRDIGRPHPALEPLPKIA